uniref:GIY-YIG domain-containing protein n=1 Tax=Panagrolaimus davidi TaxID=227884 RepID=A0A914QUP5_9BILA
MRVKVRKKLLFFLLIFIWMITAGCAMETPSKLLLDALSLISPKRTAPMPNAPPKRARRRMPVIDENHQFNQDETMIMNMEYFKEITSEEKFAEDTQKASSSSQQMPSNDLTFNDVEAYIQQLQRKIGKVYYLYDADYTNEDEKFDSIFYFGVTTESLQTRLQGHRGESEKNNPRKYQKFNGADGIQNIGIALIYTGQLSLCLMIEKILIQHGNLFGLDLVNIIHNTPRKQSNDTVILRRLIQTGVNGEGVQEYIDGLKAKYGHVYFLFDATCTTAESKLQSIFYFGYSKNIQDRLMKHKIEPETKNPAKWAKFNGPEKLQNIGICSIYEGELSLCLMIEEMLINHGSLLKLNLVNKQHVQAIDESADTPLLKRLIYRAIMVGSVFKSVGLTHSAEEKKKSLERLKMRISDPILAAKHIASVTKSFYAKSIEARQPSYKSRNDRKKANYMKKMDYVVAPIRNAYNMFQMGFFARYNKELKLNADRSKYWHGLSKDERDYWEEQSQEDTKRHTRDMKGFELFQHNYGAAYGIALENEAAIRQYWRDLSDEEQQRWISDANKEDEPAEEQSSNSGAESDSDDEDDLDLDDDFDEDALDLDEEELDEDALDLDEEELDAGDVDLDEY